MYNYSSPTPHIENYGYLVTRGYVLHLQKQTYQATKIRFTKVLLYLQNTQHFEFIPEQYCFIQAVKFVLRVDLTIFCSTGTINIIFKWKSLKLENGAKCNGLQFDVSWYYELYASDASKEARHFPALIIPLFRTQILISSPNLPVAYIVYLRISLICCNVG